MKNANRIANTLICAGLLSVAGSVVHASGDIPVVPASVMRDGVPPPIGAKPSKGQVLDPLARVNDSAIIVMEPGVNQLAPIAIGHLNRIVTPFDQPAVNTTSNADTRIENNIVYVSTSDKMPVTMFLTQAGDESRALSLTLVPQQIPPRELFLRMPDHMQQAGMVSNARAEKWENSQPYIDTIRSLFRHIALGEIPQGYTMSGVTSGVKLPACEMPGVTFDFSRGQVLNGHSLSVVVGVARNVSGREEEIKESACGDWDVAAVAAWPHNVLMGGQATEIYVARKIQRKTGPVSKRPSLIGGY